MHSHIREKSQPSSKSQPALVRGGKSRIFVMYGNQEHCICWYGEQTPPSTIEGAIRNSFRLAAECSLILKDTDGDVIAISASLPPGQSFTLEISESTNSVPTHSVPVSMSMPFSDVQQDASPIVQQTAEVSDSQTKSSYDYRPYESVKPMGCFRDELSRKKRRFRRKASDIDRTFKCPANNCQRVYGSENALKMHIKLKHSKLAPEMLEQLYINPQKPSPVKTTSLPVIQTQLPPQPIREGLPSISARELCLPTMYSTSILPSNESQGLPSIRSIQSRNFMFPPIQLNRSFQPGIRPLQDTLSSEKHSFVVPQSFSQRRI
jgi:hypothetical protein